MFGDLRFRLPLVVGALLLPSLGWAQTTSFNATEGSDKIQVAVATYGFNVSPTFYANSTADLQRICDGQKLCWYKILTTRLGDPAYGRTKDFSVSWRCGGRELHSAYSPPEAGRGSMIALSCDTAVESNPPPPSILRECEGSGGCGIWRFIGKQGQGEWPYGAVADLTITHIDNSSINIWRTDEAGSSIGLSANYRGVLTGDKIQGDVIWSWNNRQTRGTWQGSSARAKDVSSQASSNSTAEALVGILLLGAILGSDTDDSSDSTPTRHMPTYGETHHIDENGHCCVANDDPYHH